MPKVKKKKKVNSFGEFENFQGVTILSKITGTHFLALQKVHQTLASNPLICSYFALLPPESYHMTVNNLYVAEDNDKWDEFISQHLDFFQSLNHLLDPANYSTQGKNNKTFYAAIEEKFIFGDAIQLRVVVSEELKRKFFAFGHSFNIQKGIPSIFHITLGYRYRDYSFNDGCLISENIQKAVVMLRRETLTVEFSPPRLCYFHNMKKFIEWSGENNPFKKEEPTLLTEVESTLFSSSRKKKRSREENFEESREYLEEKNESGEANLKRLRVNPQ